jgi:hypothetical protein
MFLNKKGRGGYILEKIDLLKHHMAVLRVLMDSGKLNEKEYEAIDFAHDLTVEEFFAEAQRTQDLIDQLKATGMLN